MGETGLLRSCVLTVTMTLMTEKSIYFVMSTTFIMIHHDHHMVTKVNSDGIGQTNRAPISEYFKEVPGTPYYNF